MFQIQGRKFLLRNDNHFNLKEFNIPLGHSLYDSKNKRYLCPDHRGNVEVENNGKYLIRTVFISNKKIASLLACRDQPM